MPHFEPRHMQRRIAQPPRAKRGLSGKSIWTEKGYRDAEMPTLPRVDDEGALSICQKEKGVRWVVCRRQCYQMAVNDAMRTKAQELSCGTGLAVDLALSHVDGVRGTLSFASHLGSVADRPTQTRTRTRTARQMVDPWSRLVGSIG
ncbi:hypothetical protein E4U43_005280 [Claviceps pusilla]|uniref:Uncharacterized protein n=1 Tax=Claviceps pusilla TaxID=123648 RepID=A0A9P7SZ10_9HYPO|nr:hypothetical protein E4U43_005280 [Claviceps pusilla]